MSLAQGNNTPTRPRIEPGSPDPESDALTTRSVRSPTTYSTCVFVFFIFFCKIYFVCIDFAMCDLVLDVVTVFHI